MVNKTSTMQGMQKTAASPVCSGYTDFSSSHGLDTIHTLRFSSVSRISRIIRLVGLGLGLGLETVLAC